MNLLNQTGQTSLDHIHHTDWLAHIEEHRHALWKPDRQVYHMSSTTQNVGKHLSYAPIHIILARKT